MMKRALVPLNSLLLLLLCSHAPSAVAQPPSHGRIRATNSGSTPSHALQQYVQSLLRKCPLPGYCVRDQGLPGPSDYLLASPGHPGTQQQRVAIADYLAGSGFQARLQQLRNLPDKRGILISAGKAHHVGNTAVLLHVLRRQYNCTLPVEIAHRGDSEVDNATRATLTAAFPPVRWLDLDQQPYPAHHNTDYTMDRYEPKIYALYHSSFQQVLMLDADNMPLQDPTYLFDAPHMVQHGAMVWLDLWSPQLSSTTCVGHDTVYPLVGLNKQAYWDALAGGQGHIKRVAESGQLLLDRVRHADVLEWLWMYTSFSRDLYHHILGDKDTIGMAFAAARKLHDLHAVALPPGIAVGRTQGDKGEHGWHFHAMMQYDHMGGLAFFHRTFEKWNDVRKPPPIVDLLTGPLPNWFIMSYLGNKSGALTPDIPGHVLQPLSPPPSCFLPTSPAATHAHHGSYARAAPLKLSLDKHYNSCPIRVYLQLLELRDLGLPVAQQPELERACRRSILLLPGGIRIVPQAGRRRPVDHQQQQQQQQHRRQPLQHPALQPPMPHAAGGTPGRILLQDNSSSSSAASDGPRSSNPGSSHFASLNERVWLRNCLALQRKDGALGSSRSGSSNSNSGGGRDGDGSTPAAAAFRGRRLRVTLEPFRGTVPDALLSAAAGPDSADSVTRGTHCVSDSQEAAGQETGTAAANRLSSKHRSRHVAAAADGDSTDGSRAVYQWPACDRVEWHTARYMLPEYAEQVGRDASGQPEPFAAAVLPTLQLRASSSSSFEAAMKQFKSAAGATAEVEGRASATGGGTPDAAGCGSLVDVLQHTSLPAAVRWVTDNIQQLPYLTQS